MPNLKTKNRRKGNLFAFTPVFLITLFLKNDFLNDKIRVIILRITGHFYRINRVINLNNYL